jgi:hypothetical protein
MILEILHRLDMKNYVITLNEHIVLESIYNEELSSISSKRK